MIIWCVKAERNQEVKNLDAKKAVKRNHAKDRR